MIVDIHLGRKHDYTTYSSLHCYCFSAGVLDRWWSSVFCISYYHK